MRNKGQRNENKTWVAGGSDDIVRMIKLKYSHSNSIVDSVRCEVRT